MPTIYSPNGQSIQVPTGKKSVKDLRVQLPVEMRDSIMFRRMQDGSLQQLNERDKVGNNDVIVTTPSHKAG